MLFNCLLNAILDWEYMEWNASRNVTSARQQLLKSTHSRPWGMQAPDNKDKVEEIDLTAHVAHQKSEIFVFAAAAVIAWIVSNKAET